MIAQERNKQVIVLGSKILSFKKKYVSMPKMIFDTPKPINLADHKLLASITIERIACQKHKPSGMAKIMLDNTGLFAHHFHTN